MLIVIKWEAVNSLAALTRIWSALSLHGRHFLRALRCCWGCSALLRYRLLLLLRILLQLSIMGSRFLMPFPECRWRPYLILFFPLFLVGIIGRFVTLFNWCFRIIGRFVTLHDLLRADFPGRRKPVASASCCNGVRILLRLFRRVLLPVRPGILLPVLRKLAPPWRLCSFLALLSRHPALLLIVLKYS